MPIECSAELSRDNLKTPVYYTVHCIYAVSQTNVEVSTRVLYIQTHTNTTAAFSVSIRSSSGVIASRTVHNASAKKSARTNTHTDTHTN